MIARRKEKGMSVGNKYSTGQECFDWWVSNSKKQDVIMDGQIEMEEDEN